MSYFKIDRSLRTACAMVLLMAVTSFADNAPTTGNPDTNASDRNFDTNQPNSIPGGLQKAEDGSNRALNKMDRGVHKGIDKSKKGMKKAKHKSEDTMDKMTEPAIEPAK